ncbi:hypothetical protein [Marmoricola sp. RAF53]|uniref:hypothetical protein n=1 Tax=Marmoricola sp. RAF53 TaxID=3233059 RepID=UPI003F9B13EA
MAENTDVPGSPDADEPTTVLPAEPVPVPETASGPAAAPVPDGPRLRDTVWNFRSMVLVAVGALLIGGALGAALMAATNNGDDGPDRVRITTFHGGDGGDDGGPANRGPMMGGPGQGFGQRGNGNGNGNGLGNGLGLGGMTDEQRQQLRDFVQQKLQELQKQSQATPTPTPSPAG